VDGVLRHWELGVEGAGLGHGNWTVAELPESWIRILWRQARVQQGGGQRSSVIFWEEASQWREPIQGK
jgi:hypothetical protein